MRIENLLKKAKHYASMTLLALFPGNEDGFIDALGLNPALYEKKTADGTVGYDFMQALKDTALKDWSAPEGMVIKSANTKNHKKPVVYKVEDQKNLPEVTEKKTRKTKARDLFGWG